jgi:DNA-binding ferritin-like protein (Dps family)
MFKKILETVIGSIDGKKEYKLYKKRVNKLPSEYKKTMLGIQTYMLNFGSLDGKELYGILDMLEIAAAEGKKVTDIIGKDIGKFCDGVIEANPEKTWISGYKKKITSRINKKIKKENK